MRRATSCVFYRHLNYALKTTSLSVVTSCPNDADEELTLACERQLAAPRTIREFTRQFPIVVDGVLFMNAACKACHGVEKQHSNVQFRFECKHGLKINQEMEIGTKIVNAYCYMKSEYDYLFVLDDAACKSFPCESKRYSNATSAKHGEHAGLFDLCMKYNSWISVDGSLYSRNFHISPFCARCVLSDELLNRTKCRPVPLFMTHGTRLPLSQGKPLHYLFSPDWETSTVASTTNIYSFHLMAEVFTGITNQAVCQKYVHDLLGRQIRRSFSMFGAYFDGNAPGISVNLLCTTLAECKQRTLSRNRPNHIYAYSVEMFLKVHLKPAVSLHNFVTSAFPKIDASGLLYDENIQYIRLTSRIHLTTNQSFSCSDGEVVIIGHDDYDILPGGNGYDIIRMRASMKTFRTDSEYVSFSYSYNAFPNAYVAVPKMFLTVCDTEINYPWLNSTATVLTILSVLGLGFIALTYFKFNKIRNVPGKNLMNMAIMMALSLIQWLSSSRLTLGVLCTGVAILMHFTWLSTFFWMNVNGFDTWRTFRTSSLVNDKESMKTLYMVYSAYAWGIPIVIVISGVTISYAIPELGFAYGSDYICWLVHPVQVISMFLFPIGLICLCNFLFFVDTVVNILRVKKLTSVVSDAQRTARDFLPYVKIPIILGTSWLLAFLGSVFNNKTMVIVSDVMNSGQGILLFAIFVSNRRVRQLYGWDGSSRSRSVVTSSTSHSNVTRQ